MKVERVTEAASEAWAELRAALWPHADRAELRREAAALLAKKPAAAAFLLRDEAGKAVAFAEATVRLDYVNGCSTSPVGFLEGIYVLPEWRRRGAARQLCAAVEGWARAQGCRELASDTGIENALGQRMHQALGFAESERVVCYHKRLD
jgi:aminoglycoside 6'-N-acetyltransferase I